MNSVLTNIFIYFFSSFAAFWVNWLSIRIQSDIYAFMLWEKKYLMSDNVLIQYDNNYFELHTVSLSHLKLREEENYCLPYFVKVHKAYQLFHW